MKDMKYYFRFLILALCVSFAACSNDDDENQKPVFPESQKIECAVGDTKELSFEASSDWVLTSSALWCTFVVDGENSFSCSGSAGKQTVTIRISNDATELLKSYKAELTLMMGGEKQVIYTVTRPMTGYEINVFNADQSVLYTKENPMLKSFDPNETFVITANTDWVVESTEGINLDVQYGAAGNTVKVKASLNPGFKKEAWEQELVFKNQKNEVIATLPVKYNGIPEDRIEFPNPVKGEVVYSYDGFTYKVGEDKHNAPLSINITAKDDKYVWAYVEYKEIYDESSWSYEYECTLMSENDSWFWVDDDSKGNVTMNATMNRGDKRTGYLLIFPKAKYDKIKNNFETLVFSKSNGITAECEENIAVNFAQEANISLTTGFKITDANNNPLLDEYGDQIPTYSYKDMTGSTEEEVIAKFGTANVSILTLPKSQDYSNILFIPNGYTGYGFELETYDNGANTLWPGVSVESYGTKGSVAGLAPNVSGDKSMVIKVLDGGKIFAVLLIERY